MRHENRREQLESWAKLFLEWKSSGLSKVKYAANKEMSVNTLKYRISAVQREAPELISGETLPATFCAVPESLVSNPGCVSGSEGSVLMLQTSKGMLQVSNGIAPILLRTAMEVMVNAE